MLRRTRGAAPMAKQIRLGAAGVAVLLCAALTSCQSGQGSAQQTDASVVQPPAVAETQAPAAAVPAPTTTTTRPAAALPPAAVTSAHGAPDRGLTPGSTFASATRARLCVSGYSRTVRNVSTATRRQVFSSYGVAYPPPSGRYELDHLVPLELGGDNTPSNLWPERYHGTGSADVKDHLENHLHALVCSGQVGLGTAQRALAGDWFAAAAKYNPVAVRSAPVTTGAPKAAATTPPKSSSQGTVHPGAFCAPAGATGHTSAGTAMVCGTTANSPDRARWHRA